MKIECFLDTNILVYAALGRTDEERKQVIALGLITSNHFGLSAQVLAEFYVNVARKAKGPLSAIEIDRWLDMLRRYPTIAVDGQLVASGIDMARRFQIHYHDAAILAAAERLGAPVLYTEDLNHGQRYGSVLVQNPFRDS